MSYHETKLVLMHVINNPKRSNHIKDLAQEALEVVRELEQREKEYEQKNTSPVHDSRPSKQLDYLEEELEKSKSLG